MPIAPDRLITNDDPPKPSIARTLSRWAGQRGRTGCAAITIPSRAAVIASIPQAKDEGPAPFAAVAIATSAPIRALAALAMNSRRKLSARVSIADGTIPNGNSTYDAAMISITRVSPGSP